MGEGEGLGYICKKRFYDRKILCTNVHMTALFSLIFDDPWTKNKKKSIYFQQISQKEWLGLMPIDPKNNNS